MLIELSRILGAALIDEHINLFAEGKEGYVPNKYNASKGLL